MPVAQIHYPFENKEFFEARHSIIVVFMNDCSRLQVDGVD